MRVSTYGVIGLIGLSIISNGFQDWEEIHLKSMCELGRSSEGDIDIAGKHLGDVWPGNLHALRERRLRKAQGLHPKNERPQKCRTDPVS